MNLNPEEIKITFGIDDIFWNVRALWRGTEIGKIDCDREGNRLKISDIQLEEKHYPHLSPLRKFLCNIGVCSRTINFRGNCIGSHMLDCLFAEARKAGIEEIWGFLIQGDIDKTPRLLAWYTRHGFTVSEPDSECEKRAVKKITKLFQC